MIWFLHGGSLLFKKVSSPILCESGLRTAAQPPTKSRTPSSRGGEISDELIKGAIGLAQLDSFYRVGIIDLAALGKTNHKLVTELRNLIALIRPSDFKALKVCALNPTFGNASLLVGGADADLVLDETLVEIKTVKDLELDRRTFNQLTGYYLLSRIAGIDGCPPAHRLDTLAIYYSRFGVLYKIRVGEIITEERLHELVPWFRDVVLRHREGGNTANAD